MKRLTGKLFFKIGIVIVIIFAIAGAALSVYMHDEYKNIYLSDCLNTMENKNYYTAGQLVSFIGSSDDFEALFTYCVEHREDVMEILNNTSDIRDIEVDMRPSYYGTLKKLFTSGYFSDPSYETYKNGVAAGNIILLYTQIFNILDSDLTVKFGRFDRNGRNYTAMIEFDDHFIMELKDRFFTPVPVDISKFPLIEEIIKDPIVMKDYTNQDVFSEDHREIVRVCTPIYVTKDYVYVLTRDKDWTSIRDDINESVFHLVSGIIIFMIAVGALIMFLMNIMITRKAAKLRHAIVEYEKDGNSQELNTYFQRIIKGNDEIDDLARELSNMALSIQGYIEEEASIAAVNEKHKVSMDIASSIQMSNLLSRFDKVTEGTDIELYAKMSPKSEVGGDYYGCVRVDDNHIAFFIADVSDKGIPAALYMMYSKTMIESDLRRGSDPADVLNTVNNSMCENEETIMFVTIWLCLLDISTGECRVVNAGHENPVVKKTNSNWDMLDYMHFLPIGSIPDAGYENHTYQLEKGDIVFVYTDGVTDAASPDGERFGKKRLVTALNNCKTNDVNEIVSYIQNELDSFINGKSQFDDITMLCFRY